MSNFRFQRSLPELPLGEEVTVYASQGQVDVEIMDGGELVCARLSLPMARLLVTGLQEAIQLAEPAPRTALAMRVAGGVA